MLDASHQCKSFCFFFWGLPFLQWIIWFPSVDFLWRCGYFHNQVLKKGGTVDFYFLFWLNGNSLYKLGDIIFWIDAKGDDLQIGLRIKGRRIEQGKKYVYMRRYIPGIYFRYFCTSKLMYTYIPTSNGSHMCAFRRNETSEFRFSLDWRIRWEYIHFIVLTIGLKIKRDRWNILYWL